MRPRRPPAGLRSESEIERRLSLRTVSWNAEVRLRIVGDIMTGKTGGDVSRREVLKRAAGSTGALVGGGAALSGGAAAKRRAVAYTFNDPVSVGDRYTIESFDGVVERVCEGRGQGNGRGRPHKVERYSLRDVVGTVLVLSNSLSLESGDEVEIVKLLGECSANPATKIQLAEV